MNVVVDFFVTFDERLTLIDVTPRRKFLGKGLTQLSLDTANKIRHVEEVSVPTSDYVWVVLLPPDAELFEQLLLITAVDVNDIVTIVDECTNTERDNLLRRQVLDSDQQKFFVGSFDVRETIFSFGFDVNCEHFDVFHIPANVTLVSVA